MRQGKEEERPEGLTIVWLLEASGPGETWISFHPYAVDGGGDAPDRGLIYHFEIN